MPETPSAATATWAGRAATVTVHGSLDPDSASQARERIAEVAGNLPQWLVLDLTNLGQRYGAECLALIALTRHLLPPDCPLDVRSDNPVVRQIVGIANRSEAPGGVRGEHKAV